jgi:DNA invertase Pin-like site-specific DNA recombinase
VIKDQSFGRRIKPKKEEGLHPNERGKLKLERNSVVYKRLSTQEQIHTSRFSLERQHRLEQLAIDEGYKPTLSPDDIEELKAQSDYPEYYWNGNILVIELDLGISGTKGQEDRPGLAMLIDLIEAGQVESIFCVDVTRLFRDSILVSASFFAKLCKEQGVIIVTDDGMHLDLRDERDYEYFIRLAQYGGQESKWITRRLGQARALKAEKGLYAGGNVPTGFYVDLDPKSETSERYLPYGPHAEIVKELFYMMLEEGSIAAVVRECQLQNRYFPVFEPEVAAWMNSRSGLRLCRPKLDANGTVIGYEISRSLLRSIFTNPIYAGFPIRNGGILKGDFPVIVDYALFMAVYEKFDSERPKRRGKVSETEPHPLQGLLFSHCRDGVLRPVYYSGRNRSSGKHGTFKCSCADNYPGQRACFYVSSHVLLESISDFVLEQISFPEVADEVRQAIEDDYSRARTRSESYKRERQELESQIDNIRYNLSRMRMDSEAAKFTEQELNSRLTQLHMLEAKQMEAYSSWTVNQEDLEFIAGFLADMRSQWHDVRGVFQARLFELILEKAIIRTDNDDFFVDIRWKTGPVDTLWVERPLQSMPCKPWSEEERDLLRQHYPSASVEVLMSLFPDRSWDTLREQATRLRISRQVRLGVKWADEEDQLLTSFANGEISYREVRRALRHHRQTDVRRRMKKLGFEMPDIRKVYWRVVNTSQNGEYRPK